MNGKLDNSSEPGSEWYLTPAPFDDWLVVNSGIIACRCSSKSYAIIICKLLNGTSTIQQSGCVQT